MTDLTPEQWTQIENALAADKKLDAIRMYRLWTGLGLKESKDIIDKHHAELSRLDPQRFPEPVKSGCSVRVGIFLLMMMGLGASWALFTP